MPQSINKLAKSIVERATNETVIDRSLRKAERRAFLLRELRDMLTTDKQFVEDVYKALQQATDKCLDVCPRFI